MAQETDYTEATDHVHQNRKPAAAGDPRLLYPDDGGCLRLGRSFQSRPR